MEIGRRLIYDKATMKVILDTGESNGGVSPFETWGELGYIDLNYGQNADEFKNLKNGLKSVKVINAETKELQFELAEHIETEEERLLREKIDLESQLLLLTDSVEGGIL